MTEYHPLFAVEGDEEEPDAEAPDIQEIWVQRKENGKYVTAPRSFQPSELMSLAQIFGEFGGGEYQLVARDSKKRIVRRVLHSLPGASKPMYDEGPAPPSKAPPQAIDPMTAMMGGAQGGVMGLVMMMMQQMMQAQSQAAANQSQMMMAFIQSMASGNQAQIAAAQEAMNRQAERDARDKESQMAMLVKLTEARGNSTGSEETFFKGVEFMRQFSTQQIEMAKATAAAGSKGGGDFDLESILESVGQALQGFSALKEMSGQGGVQVAAEAASQAVS